MGITWYMVRPRRASCIGISQGVPQRWQLIQPSTSFLTAYWKRNTRPYRRDDHFGRPLYHYELRLPRPRWAIGVKKG
jgi:hypothetical protein